MAHGPDRTAQKSRTRNALLAGARTLLAQGKPVTLAAAADLHGISRATAYRYFSDAGLLVAEAGLAVSVADYEDVVADAPDLRAKLRAINLYFFDLALAHEPSFRRFVGMTLTAWTPDRRQSSRGARRIAMYERALAEAGSGLSRPQQVKLVRSLAMTTGAEAMIALLDVAETDAETARETVATTTDAVLSHFLDQGAR